MPRLRDSSLRSGFKLLGLWLLLQASVQAANHSECITLKSVHIEASEILDESAQSDLIMPFLGGCLDEGLVRAVLSAISNDFIARGYVTSRPYLLEQDISDGRIEIRILVGMVEAIVDADSDTSNAKIKTAFLFSDRILNLRDLETSLEIMERAESVTASFEIRPGEQPGGSVVAIKTLQSNRFHGELGAIAQSDFDSQLSFQATLDNPFNINDIVELRYNSGEAFQSIQSDRSRELVYSFPLGSYLIALNHSDSDFKQRVQGISSSFIAEGNTVSDELRVSKLLTRSQTGKLSLAFALKIKDSNNFFEEQLIDVSSYKTSQLSVELRHQWLQQWGQLDSSYRYHQGLGSFGARDDDYYTIEDGFESEARLQFEKFVVDSQLYYYLDPVWHISSRFYLQYSDDILFSNDRLNIGSPYTVRGYSTALSGSSAWYLRSDLTRRLQSVANPFTGQAFSKSVSLSAGLDYGEVKCEIDNPDVCGEIYAIALGLEIVDANFYGRLQWGHPLKQIGDDIGEQNTFFLDLRWAL